MAKILCVLLLTVALAGCGYSEPLKLNQLTKASDLCEPNSGVDWVKVKGNGNGGIQYLKVKCNNGGVFYYTHKYGEDTAKLVDGAN